MVGTSDLVGRNIPDELAFGRKRVLAQGREADAFGNTEHVCVNGHRRAVVDDLQYDIGGFTSYAGERHQIVDRVGNLSVEAVDKHTGHAEQ